MYHGTNRRHKPANVGERPIWPDLVVTNIWCAITLCLVAKTDHFAGLRIKLGMCRESDTWKLSFEVVQTFCLQSRGIHRIWRGVFLQGQQLPIEEDNVGICCATDLEPDGICELIPIFSCTS